MMTIEPNTLERLLTDQALGALPPDAEALLATYLAEHPEARALSSRIAQTVSVARTALADPVPQIPPFPAGKFGGGSLLPLGGGCLARLLSNQDRALANRAPLITRLAALAACVLLGVGLHAALTTPHPAPNQAPSQQAVALATNTLPPHPPAAEPRRPGFWSARQWYERSEQLRSEPSRRVIWDSPLTRPRIGDAL